MIIYTSAPYTQGDQLQNVRNACLAGDKLLEMGHYPVIPHLSALWHAISPKSYQEWLRIDTALIPRMDAVLRLPGESKGADNEVALALALGIKVYYSLEMIP